MNTQVILMMTTNTTAHQLRGPTIVPAVFPWKTNAHLIEDVASLYIRDEDTVLDLTYGEGIFWKIFKPKFLIGCDINPDKSPVGCSVDFTNTGFDSDSIDVVVLDPPYKLNGTPDPSVDARYGVDITTNWKDRYQLIYDGLKEADRLAKSGGLVMLKCQDQVCSGKIRFQTYDFKNYAEDIGMKLIDRFDMIGTGRPQPAGRRQVHAHGRSSTLLVFRV